MIAILHTSSGKHLRVEVQPLRDIPRPQMAKFVTEQFNDAGMADRVLWSEIPLFVSKADRKAVMCN